MAVLRAVAVDDRRGVVEIEYDEATGDVTGIRCVNRTARPMWVQVRHPDTNKVIVERVFQPMGARLTVDDRDRTAVRGGELGSVELEDAGLRGFEDPRRAPAGQLQVRKAPHVAMRWPA